MTSVHIRVNGELFSRAIDDRLSLADFVREQCLLTGTHVGCEHGVCGACTLMVSGKPVRSCITLAAAADGARIKAELAGNLCRCTGYLSVVDAIEDVCSELGKTAEPARI